MTTSFNLKYFFIFSIVLHLAFVFYVNTPKAEKNFSTPVVALKINNFLPPTTEKKQKEKVIETETITEKKKILPKEKPLKKISQPVPAVAAATNQRISKVARTNYENILAAWLAKYKRYPSRALKRRITGEGLLFVKINSVGNVLDYKLNQSTTHQILDQEIIEMLKRAEPLPKIPSEFKLQQYSFKVPVSFEISSR